MGDYDQRYQQSLYLSPDQQDLLLAALTSNNSNSKRKSATPNIKTDQSPGQSLNDLIAIAPSSGGFDNANLGLGEDESPFLDFSPDQDFDFPNSVDLIGDLPGSAYDIGEKRKFIDGTSDIEGDEIEVEEVGKKRRESEAKKPGRKPLTSEPTTVCRCCVHVTGTSHELTC